MTRREFLKSLPRFIVDTICAALAALFTARRIK